MVALEEFTKAITDLDEEKAIHLVNEFLASDPSQGDITEAIKACQEGMSEVGNRYEAKDYFLAELIFSSEVFRRVMELIRPRFKRTAAQRIGKVALGTAKGDIHDIGKDIVRTMLEAGGFEVHDLGVDVSSQQFVNTIEEITPQIVGMSGLITPTFDSMKATVDAIKAAGLREDVKIIIGGNLVDQVVSEHVGADGFSNSAPEGVKICKRWVGVLE